LFGTIAIFLFIVNNYNSNSFEITLGASLFHSKDEVEQNTFKKYNFVNFILNGLYNLLIFIGLSPNWATTK